MYLPVPVTRVNELSSTSLQNDDQDVQFTHLSAATRAEQQDRSRGHIDAARPFQAPLYERNECVYVIK